MAEYAGPLTFLWIAIILLVARFSRIVERFGQPSVLGELLIGVILGNLVLLGISVFEPIKADPIIAFLAQLGIVILLFEIGLESNTRDMLRVGTRAFLVATIGVVAPFILGALIFGPWLLPGFPFNTYLFFGATLAATSIGITARVFRDLGKLQSIEAQIVLGAAVIDDVLGLIMLAVVSGIVAQGAVGFDEVALIIVKAIVFLGGAIVAGQLLVDRLGKWLSHVRDSFGAKLTLAISFGLVSAYLAGVAGLAPAIGAFAAGLALDPVHFRQPCEVVIEEIGQTLRNAEPETKERVSTIIEINEEQRVENIISPLTLFLAPIFFVLTGMALNLQTLFNPLVLLVALGVTIAAAVGKVISGFAAGNANKLIVGCGMIPRGEVGLIFAGIGKSLSVFSDEVFAVIVIVVILTTFITPPLLTLLVNRGSTA